MKRYTLIVAKREVTGKKVKKLRKDGILPANIYGKDIESISVQVPVKDFEAVYKEAGETGLLDVDIDGAKKPVLIHNVQIDHLTNQLLHADFYQVNLKEKVKTMVRVVIKGEAQAVTDKIGQLLQTLNEIEVEALPGDLPENFEVDVTDLKTVDDQITIADLKKTDGVTILTEPTQVVVKIAQLVEPEPVVETAPAEGAEPEVVGKEPSESEEKPTEEKKQIQEEKK